MAEYIPFPITVFSFKFLIVIEICWFPSCPKEIKINSIFHGFSFRFSLSLAVSTIIMLVTIVASTNTPADPINQVSATLLKADKELGKIRGELAIMYPNRLPD